MINNLFWLANILALVNASPINARAAFARAGISLADSDTITTLAAGDTIAELAASVHLQPSDIGAANPGINLATVRPGQILTIPSAPPVVRREEVPETAAGRSTATTATPTLSALSAVSVPASQATLALGSKPVSGSAIPASSALVPSSVVSPPAAPGSSSVSVSNGVSLSSSSVAASSSAAASSSPPATAPSSTGASSSASAPSSSSASPSASAPATTGSPSVPGSGAAVTGAAAADSVSLSTGSDSNPDQYTFFKGDGSPGAGWPKKEQWVSFNEMFKRNLAVMGKDCVGGVTPNTDAENDLIKAAIPKVATAAKVDPRLILALVIQESRGCVRVPTTGSGEAGVTNPGLLQSFNGAGNCNNSGRQINPCPGDQITQMLVDGVQGTPGSGVVQHIAEVNGDASGQTLYKAVRKFNSGVTIAVDVLENAGKCGPPRLFGIPCYSSDIANRLMGWVSAPTQCTLQPEGNCKSS